jgi:hypothetical protein
MVIIGCLKSLLLGHLLFLEKDKISKKQIGGLKMDIEDFLDFCKKGNIRWIQNG